MIILKDFLSKAKLINSTKKPTWSKTQGHDKNHSSDMSPILPKANWSTGGASIINYELLQQASLPTIVVEKDDLGEVQVLHMGQLISHPTTAKVVSTTFVLSGIAVAGAESAKHIQKKAAEDKAEKKVRDRSNDPEAGDGRPKTLNELENSLTNVNEANEELDLSNAKSKGRTEALNTATAELKKSTANSKNEKKKKK